MSLTDHRGAAVAATHYTSLSGVSRPSSRSRCAVGGPRTSTMGISPIHIPRLFTAAQHRAPRPAELDR